MIGRGIFALNNVILPNGKRLTMLEEYHPEEWFDIPNRYNTDVATGKKVEYRPLDNPEDMTGLSMTPGKARDVVSVALHQNQDGKGIKPTKKYVEPDVYESEFGHATGEVIKKKKIRPRMKKTMKPDAFEQEFEFEPEQEPEPKPKRTRKHKEKTVGEQIHLMATKVLNPKTNRWVFKTSRLGKQILKSLY
jgi:hypothetical protein